MKDKYYECVPYIHIYNMVYTLIYMNGKKGKKEFNFMFNQIFTV